MDRVVIERNGIERQIGAKVVADVSKLRPLLNKECWRIFERAVRRRASVWSACGLPPLCDSAAFVEPAKAASRSACRRTP